MKQGIFETLIKQIGEAKEAGFVDIPAYDILYNVIDAIPEQNIKSLSIKELMEDTVKNKILYQTSNNDCDEGFYFENDELKSIQVIL